MFVRMQRMPVETACIRVGARRMRVETRCTPVEAG